MASTNKTAHLALNQWVLSDPLLMEDMNADNSKIDAAVGAMPYVKLLDITTTADAQQVDLDVSGIDFSKLAMVQLFSNALPLPMDISGSAYVRINNEGGAVVVSMYNYAKQNKYTPYVAMFDSPTMGSVSLKVEITGFISARPDDVLELLVRTTSACRGYMYDTTSYYCQKQIGAANQFKTINFLNDNVNKKFSAGSRFIMYGVKL